MARILDLKKEAAEFLQGRQDMLAVELLLGEVLGMDKKQLFMAEQMVLDDVVQQRFWQLLEEFKAGRPIAQILGCKEFYGLNFLITDKVLIPRPETELVVDLAKDFIAQNLADLETVKVLDVGTGSGCIILALAAVVKKVKGLGLEVSVDALEVAKKNLVNLDLSERVYFEQSDLLEYNLKNSLEKFDIILANLPYIGRKRFNFVSHDVAAFEPEVALFGGDDGLDLYRRMFEELAQLSWKPALILGEFGFGQEEEMRKLLGHFFPEFEIIPDLAGIPRVFVVGSLQNN